MRNMATVILMFLMVAPLNSGTCQPAQQEKAYNAIKAGNPIVPGYFADPTIRKFGNTYF